MCLGSLVVPSAAPHKVARVVGRLRRPVFERASKSVYGVHVLSLAQRDEQRAVTGGLENESIIGTALAEQRYHLRREWHLMHLAGLEAGLWNDPRRIAVYLADL